MMIDNNEFIWTTSSVSTIYIHIITGGNWPSTLALWLVDGLTLKSCIGAVGSCEKSAPLDEVCGFWNCLQSHINDIHVYFSFSLGFSWTFVKYIDGTLHSISASQGQCAPSQGRQLISASSSLLTSEGLNQIRFFPRASNFRFVRDDFRITENKSA